MKKLKTLLIILCFLVTNSCSKFNQIAISSVNFEEVIQLSQNLIFTFNKDLAEENELNKWFNADLIEIMPKVPGKFKWTSKNTLIFSPSESFAASTKYTAKLSNDLSENLKVKIPVDSDIITFHTPFPELLKTETFWTKPQLNEVSSTNLKLIFNYNVNPNELSKFINISSDNEKIDYELVKNLEENSVVLHLKKELEEEDELDISIEKGSKIANYELDKNIESESEVPIKDVEVTEVTSEFEDNIGVIKVITNAELKSDNLEKFVEVVSEKVLEEGKSNIIKTRFEMLENGFLIYGDFNETEVYKVLIKKGLETKLNTKLEADFEKEITFGELPSNISFSAKKAIYLSSKGNKNIGVNISNISKVDVKISKIYENNILQYINSKRYAQTDYEEGEEGEIIESNVKSRYFTYNDDYNQEVSDIIVDKKIDTRSLPKNAGLSVLNLNLPNQQKMKGIYLVTVNSEKEYYQRDTRLVSISDIGIITKKGTNELLVFTNSINDTEALNEVEISLVSTNNQLITSKKTNKKGIVVFENLKETLGDYKVAMITARLADDFNYLVLDGSEVETSRFEVEGKRETKTGFDAFIYGDRNIYRPGEMLHFVSVVRAEKWAVVKDIPLKVRLLMPNGKEFFTAQKNTNEQGAIELSIPTDKSVVTGMYNFEVLNGNDVLLASKAVNIEEFMPDRIKVDVKTNKDFYQTGDNIALTATATNMFGPPAVGRNYEMEMKLSRVQFSSKKFNDYRFDISKTANFENEIREGKTVEKGIATESFKISDDYKDIGLLEAKMYVTVFDESSRPVNRLKKLNIYTQNLFYGIKMQDYFVGTNQPIKFDLIALNKDQLPTNSNAIVEFVQSEYQTVIEKYDGGYQYVSKKKNKVISKKKVALKDGFGNHIFTPMVSGEYEIRVYPEGATGWTSQSFYAYSYGSTENTSFEVNNEGNVDISFDKESYESGEKAKVLFKTPFAGKMLVTVERNKILEHHYLNTDKKSAELTINLGKEHLPNVYVSATLFRPMNGDNIPLTVAHGFASADVIEKTTVLPIQIIAETKSRSNTKQKVLVKTGKPNSQVTIAVVDEGILQVKNFKTPDIHNFFYQKRALEVESFDLYPFLFPEISIGNASSFGGDGYDLEKRVNPLSNGRVELVALWSGILTTNAAGEASFDFNVPQFTGDLRIMAVAYKDHAFGSANQNMIVADPIVINSALPRFLSPTDQVTVPITLNNTTKSPMTINVQAITTGGLIIEGQKSMKMTIPAEKEGRTSFTLKAPNQIGEASVTIQVDATDEKFTNKTEINIRPASSLMKVFQTGNIQTEKTESINLSKQFIESTANHKLVVSYSPLVKMTNHFQDLLGYPHGCLEQTTSKAFPQIFLADFAKEVTISRILKSKNTEFNPNQNVQAAINRLESMLTTSGGLSMWQGGTDAFWWGTAYAAHFLVESQKAGYEVNKKFLNKVMAYLTSSVNTNKPDENFSYFGADGSIKVKIKVKSEVIYSLYVLAISGNPNKSLMNYYKQNVSKLLVTEKFLLAAAFNIIGDNASFNALLPKQFNEEKGVNYTGTSLYSPIRNLAIALNSLIDSDQNNLMVPALARQLSVAVEASKFLNTQEESFAFLALGKFAKQSGKSTMNAMISSNGKAIGDFTGKNLTFKDNLSENISIKTSGSGGLYYFIESEGISKTGKVVEEDKLLKARRTFYTREGLQIKDNVFKQNQLIVVKLTLESANDIPIKNIVLTDILPAGFEIENPRISPERELDWIKDQSLPEHFDIRDDRINFFTNANKPKSFYYLIRAVSKGKFVVGPVSADAMYQTEYRSYHGAGTINIQ